MSIRFVAAIAILAAIEAVPYSYAQSQDAGRTLLGTPQSRGAHSDESSGMSIPQRIAFKLVDAKHDEIYTYVERISEGPLETVPEFGAITVEEGRANSNPHARMLRVMLCMHENMPWLGIDEIELHGASIRRITGTWQCNPLELSKASRVPTSEPPLGGSSMDTGEIFWTGPRTFSWSRDNCTYDFEHLGGSEFWVSMRIHEQ